MDFGTCGFTSDTHGDTARAFVSYNYYSNNTYVPIQLQKKNHLLVQVWNGKIVFYLNGVKGPENIELSCLKGDLSQTKTGFAACDIPGAIHVSNIAVRLAKSEPKEPTPEELQPAK